MIIIRCKGTATTSNLKELKEFFELKKFIESQVNNDIIVVPSDCEVIYTDDSEAQWKCDDDDEVNNE